MKYASCFCEVLSVFVSVNFYDSEVDTILSLIIEC